MTLTIELDREADGRWIAEVLELSGVMVYGPSRVGALTNVKALALQGLAERIERDEAPDPTTVEFVAAA
jgi:predicted RNase H-like HicB family nuclease